MIASHNMRWLLLSSTLTTIGDSLTWAIVIPFLVFLGAKPALVGTVMAFPYIATMLAELMAVEIGGQKSFVVLATALSRFFWIVLAFVAFDVRLAAVLLFMVWLFYRLSVPGWTSIVGSVVPFRIRGRYLAMREMAVGISGALFALIAGAVLDAIDPHIAFPMLFLTGGVIGIAAAAALGRITTRPMSKRAGLRKIEIGGTFGRFVGAAVYWSFAYMIVSPFFIVYLLTHLGVDYVFVMAVVAADMLARVLTVTHWGKLIDTYGARSIASIALSLSAVIPLAYLFLTPATAHLAILIHTFGGFVFSGINLSMFNLLLSVTNAEKRVAQTVVFDMLTAIPLAVAPIVGGLIAERAAMFWLFVIAVLLRATAGLGINCLKEGKRTPVRYLLRDVLHPHPLTELRHQIRWLESGFRGRPP